MKKDPLQQPAGLYIDVLHEIRKARRALNRAETRIMKHLRQEKKRHAATKS